MMVEKSFDTGKSVLNYAEGPDSGPPLVMLHGLSDRWQFFWQFFLPIIPFLSQRWHIYALDFRGHGSSSRSPPYRYQDHVDDVIAFLENVPTETSFVYGASLGGMISLMVAAKRPDLVQALVFSDANIKIKHVREVMMNYRTFWSGWEKIAGMELEMDELVKVVADMPIKIPWRPEGKYGDGLDYISILNKATYLKHLDSAVLSDWAKGEEDDEAYRRVTEGYDETLIKNIKCPVLLMQGNMEKGAILTDDEVEYALSMIPNAQHIYFEEHGHNMGLYSFNTAKLLQTISIFLESFR